MRARVDELGVRVFGEIGLDFYDPWGNLIQVVDYRDVQFLKTDEVLRAQGHKAIEASGGEAGLLHLANTGRRRRKC